jgi:hypothetical protein
MTIGIKIKKIKKIKNLDQSVKVYDIEVENAHHYILGDGTVSHNSYVPTKELSGGSGLKYAASTIIYLSKKKEKDGTEVIGNIIKAKTFKSRLSKENKEVEIRLFYDHRGLDRYYGLPQLAVEAGVWKYNAGRYEIEGKKIFEKEILRNPETYFTEEVMNKINEYAKNTFSYGN